MSKKGYCGAGCKVIMKDSFAERLDMLMMEHNENCCDIAKICGLNRRAVYAWFDNKHNVKAVHAFEI